MTHSILGIVTYNLAFQAWFMLVLPEISKWKRLLIINVIYIIIIIIDIFVKGRKDKK